MNIKTDMMMTTSATQLKPRHELGMQIIFPLSEPFHIAIGGTNLQCNGYILKEHIDY